MILNNSIYKMESNAEGKQFVFPSDTDLIDFIQQFNGRSFSGSLGRQKLRIYTKGDKGETLNPTDNYYLAANIFAFSNKAVSVMKELMLRDGELIETDKEIALFNCTRIVDALNEEKSDIARLPTGRIVMFRRLVLDLSKCKEYSFFRLTQTPLGYVYVSGNVKDAVERAGLEGFLFSPVDVC